jgi:hypothetical protein
MNRSRKKRCGFRSWRRAVSKRLRRTPWFSNDTGGHKFQAEESAEEPADLAVRDIQLIAQISRRGFSGRADVSPGHFAGAREPDVFVTARAVGLLVTKHGRLCVVAARYLPARVPGPGRPVAVGCGRSLGRSLGRAPRPPGRYGSKVKRSAHTCNQVLVPDVCNSKARCGLGQIQGRRAPWTKSTSNKVTER